MAKHQNPQIKKRIAKRPGMSRKERTKQYAKLARTRELEEIQMVTKAIQALADVGEFELTPGTIEFPFAQLPASKKTKDAMKDEGFIYMTEIQRKALPHALAGKDILAAAPTGSGKTLAFLIPIVEKIWRDKWTANDGCIALVISPTRELAIQIFQVLRQIGKNHSISAGLVIGGKDVEHEKERIPNMSIIVGTPGRLLQHMDETPYFNCENLQCLVLDEADRILDMGFRKTIDAILKNLPTFRQTLLFSATQTRSVSALARLSLKNPQYISVLPSAKKKTTEDEKDEDDDDDDDAANAEKNPDSHHKSIGEVDIQDTPQQLAQSYVLHEVDKKLDVLWSFIKNHLSSKIIIFFSSCKQVRFVFETFRRMQPGLALFHIHGRMQQNKRLNMYHQFAKHEQAALFATDIAARGLDFPAVDWVVQVDCPENVEAYVHRVGRTARNKNTGNSLLILRPSEERFISRLREKKITDIKKTKLNMAKIHPIKPKLTAILAENVEIKHLGQKAFICYLRSLYLQADKEVFDVNSVPFAEYADSLGLPTAPKVKFPKTHKIKPKEKDIFGYRPYSESEHDDDDNDSDLDDTKEKKSQKGKEKRRKALVAASSSDDEHDDDFMRVKRVIASDAQDSEKRDEEDQDEEDNEDLIKLQKQRKLKIKKDGKASVVCPAQRTVFEDLDDTSNIGKSEQDSLPFIDLVRKGLAEADEEDKRVQKERLREKRKRRREKELGVKREERNSGVVFVGPEGSDSGSNHPESQPENSSSGSSHSASEGSHRSDSDKEIELSDGYKPEEYELLAQQILKAKGI